MKKVRLIATGLMVAALGTASITSCTKDPVVCPVGYEGEDCKTLSRAKMVGTWNGTETCTSGSYPAYNVVISNSGTSEIGVLMTNIYNQSFSGTGTMTGDNTFSFSGSEGAVTYSGSGTLNTTTGKLTLSYNISGASSDACTFTGSKL